MSKPIWKSAVFATILAVLAVGLNPAHAAVQGRPGAMAQRKMYFRHHSLGFPFIFFRFHPGPHWDLTHAAALHLTPQQVTEERHLTMGMMIATGRGIRRLKAAYRTYREAARAPNPSIRALVRDVMAVGRAQTYLGYVMIPFHLKGYRLLDPTQQAIYHRLAAEMRMHMRQATKRRHAMGGMHR
jgi:hypothetical protein